MWQHHGFGLFSLKVEVGPGRYIQRKNEIGVASSLHCNASGVLKSSLGSFRYGSQIFRRKVLLSCRAFGKTGLVQWLRLSNSPGCGLQPAELSCHQFLRQEYTGGAHLSSQRSFWPQSLSTSISYLTCIGSGSSLLPLTFSGSHLWHQRVWSPHEYSLSSHNNNKEEFIRRI